jgi:hypothetical protein
VAGVAGPKAMRVAYAIAAALALVSVVVACGGGTKSYTYNLAGKANDPAAAGLYLTLISPVKLPPLAFKSARLVDHVTGAEDCVFTQRINKPPRKYAALKGTKLTVQVHGDSPMAKFICGVIRKSGSSVQIVHP